MNSTITPHLRLTATYIMAPISIVGVVLNTFCAICLLRLRSFRNSFGYLTAFHALSDASLLLVFAVWSTPTTIMRIPPRLEWLNNTFGSLSILFQHMSFHSSLTIAINRFLAITFPVFYRNFFTTKFSIVAIVFIIIYSFIYWGVFFVDDCKFFFNDETIIWQFSDTPCGQAISLYIDLIYCVALFGLESLLDALTLGQLIVVNMKLKKMSTLAQGFANEASRKKEILYFTQAAANTFVYVMEITCFHLVNPFMTTPFSQFMTTTFAWACGHLGGGIVLLVFNPSIRKRLANPRHLFWSDTTTHINLIKVTTGRRTSEMGQEPKKSTVF